LENNKSFLQLYFMPPKFDEEKSNIGGWVSNSWFWPSIFSQFAEKGKKAAQKSPQG
jgi:hypothetical protein